MRKTERKNSHQTRNRLNCKSYGAWSAVFPFFVLTYGELFALEDQSSGDRRGAKILLFPSQHTIQNKTEEALKIYFSKL